ncbi:hypothetical protein DPSP01_001806 [Paraphaeosphaeria sporulosa]|uniref:Uncharacterized protein n=1 Tax=Paraphaeosphaeria sporulosa TaxID=1460663 RepID=A0A177C253_9PLEO|nr:uncharacterized protein CC84DRAFT_1208900 [Paraphaeosphaeria sporulosa]OAG01864.1 hypothetical protein CC84DRAFT_1208900 [Paraphaeosphaeria sporulosa]
MRIALSFAAVSASIAAAASPTNTVAPLFAITPTPPSPTCTLSICADYINSCGRWYGGCYAACPGYTTPSFTDPGCPTTSRAVSATPTTCTTTLCADYINNCGLMYGGCFPACSGYTIPSFADPGCPTSTPYHIGITVARK